MEYLSTVSETSDKKSVKKYKEEFQKAGLILKTEFNDNQFVTFEEFYSNFTFDLIPNFELPKNFTLKCDNCGKVTINECLCGENYCSKKCQIQDWKKHKHICKVYQENNQTGLLITTITWSKDEEIKV